MRWKGCQRNLQRGLVESVNDDGPTKIRISFEFANNLRKKWRLIYKETVSLRLKTGKKTKKKRYRSDLTLNLLHEAVKKTKKKND